MSICCLHQSQMSICCLHQSQMSISCLHQSVACIMSAQFININVWMLSTCGLCVSVVLLCVTVSICLASVQMSVCCLFLMTPAYAPAWLCCTSDFSSLGLLRRAGQEGQVWSTSQGFPLGCVVSHIQCDACSVHSRYADVRGDLSTIAWHTGHVVFPQYIDNLTCETATISQLVTAQSTGETITISNSLKHIDDLTCETTTINQLVTAWSSCETITISGQPEAYWWRDLWNNLNQSISDSLKHRWNHHNQRQPEAYWWPDLWNHNNQWQPEAYW